MFCKSMYRRLEVKFGSRFLGCGGGNFDIQHLSRPVERQSGVDDVVMLLSYLPSTSVIPFT